MGELELGKLDMEYVKDPDLRELLAETSLDNNKMKGIENQKLRLIYDVVYSERFELKGQRGDEVTVDAGLEANLPQTENPANILAARLKGFYKKKAIPPTIATRNERGPVFFKCVRVDYDKATGKLNLREEEVVGQSTHRGKEVDKDYQETMVASEIEQNDCADNDFKKLETIEKVVLMSSASREKRKERVRKYLQWFERALVEDVTTLTLTEPLTDEDHRFIKEIFLPPPSDELIVDLSSFETERIQGYAIVLKKINDLSDEDWDDIEKAWAEAGQEK